MSEFRIGTQSAAADRERPVLHAEAMAGVLEVFAEQVDLLRDELWQMRAQLGGDR